MAHYQNGVGEVHRNDRNVTRWVELFHTEDATALSTAKCLLQHFGRFGAPLQLRSDNGPHFIFEDASGGGRGDVALVGSGTQSAG